MDTMIMDEHPDFSSPWHFSNVVFLVGKRKFHVHKCILSLWSPVFNAMFTSQFKESKAKEIRLPGKTPEEIEVLLRLIYSSGTKQAVTDDNYQFLVRLADEYQIDRVKSMCSEFLVKKIQVSNCLEYFKLADQYSLSDVKKKCHQEVRYNSSADLEGSEHFNGFEPGFKVDICMKIIKELEKTLEEYVTTCSDLVQRIHRKVYRNSIENEKKDIKSACSNCIGKAAVKVSWKRVDGGYDYSIIKEPVNKLYDLQQKNKVAAIVLSKEGEKYKPPTLTLGTPKPGPSNASS